MSLGIVMTDRDLREAQRAGDDVKILAIRRRIGTITDKSIKLLAKLNYNPAMLIHPQVRPIDWSNTNARRTFLRKLDNKQYALYCGGTAKPLTISMRQLPEKLVNLASISFENGAIIWGLSGSEIIEQDKQIVVNILLEDLNLS